MEDKKKITVSGMLQHLKDGMTRKEIATHYGMTQAECKIHFQNPLLKNKKTITAPVLTYTLVDDITTKAADIVVEATEVKVEPTDNVEANEQADNNDDANVVAAPPVEAKKEGVVGKGEDKVEQKEETPVAKATWG